MARQKESMESAKTPAPAGRSSMFPLGMLRDDIDRAFDRLFHDWPRFGSMRPSDLFGNGDLLTRTGAVAPRVDVCEDDDSYEITAEMPGVDEKDVEITLRENRLTLRGEKKTEREEKEKDYHMSERSYGSFERSFTLPRNIDAEKIEAKFDKGILKLTLPKTPEAKSKERKIQIKGDSR